MQAFPESLDDLAALGNADLAGAHGLLRHQAKVLLQALGFIFHIAQDIGDAVAVELAGELEAAVGLDGNIDNVGVAKQVVQVTQGLLVGAHQEHAEIVLLACPELV